jgi:hypothetical protein
MYGVRCTMYASSIKYSIFCYQAGVHRTSNTVHPFPGVQKNCWVFVKKIGKLHIDIRTQDPKSNDFFTLKYKAYGSGRNLAACC